MAEEIKETTAEEVVKQYEGKEAMAQDEGVLETVEEDEEE